jgi:adenylate cyclase, class 2
MADEAATYEVELKVRADHSPVADRLATLGAEDEGWAVQVDTYYDRPGGSLASADEALRLRAESGSDRPVHLLTYKGPRVDSGAKTRRETETRVSDPDAARTILRSLGFEPVAVVRKRRVRYRCRGYAVALDTVQGLGTFVEVEGHAESTSRAEEVTDGVRRLLTDLGLDPDRQIRRSYLELLLESGGGAGKGGAGVG